MLNYISPWRAVYSRGLRPLTTTVTNFVVSFLVCLQLHTGLCNPIFRLARLYVLDVGSVCTRSKSVKETYLLEL